MGSLPSDRVRPSRAFAVTGVDFADPITTLVNKGRGRKTNKSYIALFVCFSTRAIHLEATKLQARELDRELQEIHQFAQAEVEGNIGKVLTNEGIEWKFIPPFSPHMGGLWEAGVKSCKYHLKRVVGSALFTFEELSTALIQIEACLNSRPLTPMSTDPADLLPLTPAHFLVGESMTSFPDTDVTDIQLNRLDRWRLVQRVIQDFWKRWTTEYIINLQGRTKWKKRQDNIQIGDLVILRDENLPPLRWKLGRVLELHFGNDDLVRVATLRTASGNFKRAITKLCKLPVTLNNDNKISMANLVGGMFESSMNVANCIIGGQCNEGPASGAIGAEIINNKDFKMKNETDKNKFEIYNWDSSNFLNTKISHKSTVKRKLLKRKIAA
ncbi:uncharacterized protein [Polyergus mexicanus]|uniref:uncharacterized protein n=1 Tax=Polyergus mexicanus TaxID=615972 RepID=UPI0038B60FA8